MAEFRIDSIGSLARQMGFAPLFKRLAQLDAAEALLLAIDAEKAYPVGYVIHGITGYRPKDADVEDAELLTGAALQHDLGLLLETVSDEMDLAALEGPEPVLTIESVCQRFGVTSKTIQRWRRKGLPARRWQFDDGKKRVGFRLSCVERFIANQEGAAQRPAGIEPLSPHEQQRVVAHARRIASAGHDRQEMIRRVARRAGRSSLAVLHTLEHHDRLEPTDAVLPLAAEPLDKQQIANVIEAFEAGQSLCCIARGLGRPRTAVYRVLIEHRAERLAAATVRYHDDPLYHGPSEREAEDNLNALVRTAQEQLTSHSGEAEGRIPRNLPPYFASLYRTPLLSAAMERALFLKFNFHKCRFAELRAAFDPHLCRGRDLDRLERHLRLARETKNRITTANLRLVVSVARKHLRPGMDLMELVSEGNIVLMRAVEGFDVHRGFRLSTYATLALMKGFARAVPQLQSSGDKAIGGDVVHDLPGADEGFRQISDRDELRALLGRLEPRERHVVTAHFGIDDSGDAAGDGLSFEELGESLGLTKHRIRQIEQSALAKLRTFATDEVLV